MDRKTRDEIIEALVAGLKEMAQFDEGCTYPNCDFT